MPNYDQIDEEYDIVLTKQKIKSKSNGKSNSNRVKGNKKKDKEVYNQKYIRIKMKKSGF